MQFTKTRTAFLAARILEIAVGVIFLIAASLKALDPVAFAEQIRQFGIFPELSGVAAWTLVTAEVVLAAGLILNWLPRIVPLASALLLLFFIGITAYGTSIGLGENCGCFGSLVYRSPTQVIIEDVLMVLALAFSIMVVRTRAAKGQTARGAVVTLIGALALLTISVSPALPVDDLVTTLKPGSTFKNWPLDGLRGVNLNRGTNVVFLFSIGDRQMPEHAESMIVAARGGTGATPVGLIIDGPEMLTTLMFQYGITFPVGAVEPRFARPMYRRLPRSFLLHEGTVFQTWPGIPDAGEIRRAVRQLSH